MVKNFKRKVLLVGHCGFDNQKIQNMLENNFDVEVAKVQSFEDAKELLEKENFHLALINRVENFDGQSGLELIKKLGDSGKINAQLMLITDYPDSMKEAVACGAVKGFGKNAINDIATIENLKSILTAPSAGG